VDPTGSNSRAGWVAHLILCLTNLALQFYLRPYRDLEFRGQQVVFNTMEAVGLLAHAVTVACAAGFLFFSPAVDDEQPNIVFSSVALLPTGVFILCCVSTLSCGRVNPCSFLCRKKSQQDAYVEMEMETVQPSAWRRGGRK
jgi:hypothetical protein